MGFAAHCQSILGGLERCRAPAQDKSTLGPFAPVFAVHKGLRAVGTDTNGRTNVEISLLHVDPSHYRRPTYQVYSVFREGR